MNREHPIYKKSLPTTPSKYSKGEWILLECAETGLVYLDNPVEYEALEEDFAWERTYVKEKEERRKKEPLFSILSDLTKKIRRAVRKTPKIHTLPVELCASHFADTDSINILDVGCGDGAYPASIAQRIMDQTGKKVTPHGIEISVGLQKISNETLAALGGSVIQASAVEGMKQMEPSSQHIIIMHSFLEHETNPLDLLKQCREALTDDGLMIIKVPNYSSWNRKIRQHKWCGFRYPDHVNYFSPNNLKLILDEAKCSVHRMNFFDKIPTSDNMWVIAKKSNT